MIKQDDRRALFVMTSENHHTSQELLSQDFILDISFHSLVQPGEEKYYQCPGRVRFLQKFQVRNLSTASYVATSAPPRTLPHFSVILSEYKDLQEIRSSSCTTEKFGITTKPSTIHECCNRFQTPWPFFGFA